MVFIFFSLFILNFIPKEFDQLKRKAIKSSLLKPLSDIKPEPIITPSKPFITNSFKGIALHPIFGETVKELKGYAVSKTRKHIAIIVDRQTEIGNAILNEQSFFFGKKNITVSLSEKFADDGEVAIFNISDVDPLSVFYNFDLRLSSLGGKCKSNFGKELGARCNTNGDLNWDATNNVPKEVKINDFPTEIQENVKLFGGISASSYVSAVLQKRGATIQTLIDGSFDANVGGGFHLNAINSSEKIPFDKEYKIGGELQKTIGSGSVTVFGIQVTLKSSLVSIFSVNNISFNIPPNIKYINVVRTLNVHLKKGLTVTSKHTKTTDFEKVVKVDKIKTEAKQDDNFIDNNINEMSNFTGTFTCKVGIKTELIIGSDTKFTIELGPEINLNLDLNASSEKCTFPALYGSFTPLLNSYVDFSGSLIVAAIKFYEKRKSIITSIYTSDPINSCLFDVESSSELDKQLLQSPERKRSIIQTVNPIVKNASLLFDPVYQPIRILGNNGNLFLGFSTLYVGKDSLPKKNEHILVQEQSKIDYVNLQLFPNDVYRSIKYSFNEEPFSFPGIDFVLIKNESQPITMGSQFNYTNYKEYKNFRRKFMSTDIQRVGLILHTKKDGYFCDPSKYYIIDEVFDEYSDDVTNWFKISISKAVQSKIERPININFFSPYDIKNKKLFIYHSMQKFGCGNQLKKDMIPFYNDIYLRIKKPLKPKEDQILMYFNVTDNDQLLIGSYNITYSDAIKRTFTKDIDDITLTFSSYTSSDDIEYIIQLEDSYINEIKKVPNTELAGIVSRVFIKKNNNNNIVFYTGSPLELGFSMENNELYGSIFFYFKDPGYDIEKNTKIYAFFKLNNAQPLLKTVKVVDEKEDLYVVKIEIGKTVFYDEEKNLFLSVPFRRRTKVAGGVNSILYCIYQSNENNDNDSPFCTSFPQFNLKTNKNFFVGCIRTYTNMNDFYNNHWDHYPQSVNEHIIISDLPIETPDENHPFIRLHAITYGQNERASEIQKIVAKQQYFIFPDESRTMVIEDDTINKFKNYAPDIPLRISCSRCGAIYMNEINESNKLFQEQTNIFTTEIKNIDGGFLLEAFCKSDKNAYCSFEYDLSNDGETLLEFNTKITDSINLLDDEVDLPEEYPGVEEIYDASSDTTTTAKSRLNINCNRQVVPSRKGKFYVNKPWEGRIKKIATHLERHKITIDIKQTYISGNYVTLKLLGKGFKSIDSSLNDQQVIPFNPSFFSENEKKFKKLLSQLGITITKTKEETIRDNDVEVNNDGVIKARRSLFSESLLESSMNGSIDLIPISNYKFSTYNEPVDESPKKGGGKKCDCSDSSSCDNDENEGKSSRKLNPLALGNFKIKTVYVGGSKVSNFPLGYINQILPSLFFLHTAIWVGPSDVRDDSLGIIFVYGKYKSKGNNPAFLFSDGAKAFVMSLSQYINNYKAFDVLKVSTKENYKLSDFINDIKKSENWTLNDYNFAKKNCQHFTASCLKILQAKRVFPEEKNWERLPKNVLKSILQNEANEIK